MDKPPFDPSKPFEAAGAAKPAFDPSKPFDAAPAAEPETGGKPLSESAKQTSSFMDTLKSIPGAVVSGLTSFGSLSEQGRRGLLGIQDEAPAQTGPEAKAAIEKGVTGPLYKAQTPIGKVAEAGVETVSNPISYVGAAAGPVRAAVSAFGGGAGGEVAGQMTGDNPLARAAGGALGGLAGGTKGAARVAETPAPAQRAIFEAAEKAYDTVQNSTRKIPLLETSELGDQIRQHLNNKRGVYRGDTTQGTENLFKTVDRLSHGLNEEHLTAGEVHSITKALQSISRTNTGNAIGAAAQDARQQIFEHLKKYPELAEAIEVGNANYRVGKTSEGLMLAKEKGELGARSTMTGDNIDPALRTQLRQMYFNKKVLKTPEEKEILRSIIEGDTASNIGKKFNLLKSPLRHLAMAVMHKSGAGILTHAAQMLAKSISNRNTARQVEKLDELVRSTAPAAGPRAPASAERSTRGAQRGVQAARGAAMGQDDKQKPNLYEQ